LACYWVPVEYAPTRTAQTSERAHFLFCAGGLAILRTERSAERTSRVERHRAALKLRKVVLVKTHTTKLERPPSHELANRKRIFLRIGLPKLVGEFSHAVKVFHIALVQNDMLVDRLFRDAFQFRN